MFTASLCRHLYIQRYIGSFFITQNSETLKTAKTSITEAAKTVNENETVSFYMGELGVSQ